MSVEMKLLVNDDNHYWYMLKILNMHIALRDTMVHIA